MDQLRLIEWTIERFMTSCVLIKAKNIDYRKRRESKKVNAKCAKSFLFFILTSIKSKTRKTKDNVFYIKKLFYMYKYV